MFDKCCKRNNSNNKIHLFENDNIKSFEKFNYHCCETIKKTIPELNKGKGKIFIEKITKKF